MGGLRLSEELMLRQSGIRLDEREHRARPMATVAGDGSTVLQLPKLMAETVSRTPDAAASA